MIKKCLICNNEFYTKPYDQHRRKTCSKKCGGILHSTRITGENNPNYGPKVIQLRCSQCKKEFIRLLRIYKKSNKQLVFCSKVCSGKYFNNRPRPWLIGHKSLSGKDNPNWRGGVTLKTRGIRHSSEYQRWRKSIIRRDKVCVLCGNDKNLHADHIKPFIFNPDLIYDINNGRTLCIHCHKKTDTYGKRVYSQRRQVRGISQPNFIL